MKINDVTLADVVTFGGGQMPLVATQSLLYGPWWDIMNESRQTRYEVLKELVDNRFTIELEDLDKAILKYVGIKKKPRKGVRTVRGWF